MKFNLIYLLALSFFVSSCSGGTSERVADSVSTPGTSGSTGNNAYFQQKIAESEAKALQYEKNLICLVNKQGTNFNPITQSCQ
jgi:hypothetical protein